jgi:hypothetical protein
MTHGAAFPVTSPPSHGGDAPLTILPGCQEGAVGVNVVLWISGRPLRALGITV